MTALLWICVIIGFTLQTGEISSANSGRITAFIARLMKLEETEHLHLIVRKVAHFSEYTILGMLLALALKTIKMYSIYAALIGFSVACCDEFIQGFVPGRGPSPKDVVIDSCGTIFGILIVTATLIAINRRKRNHETR